MRTLTGIAAVLFIQLLAGCDKPPAAPTPTLASPGPKPPPEMTGEKWNLTTTFTSVIGSAACVDAYTKYLGQQHDWQLTIERSGDSIRLVRGMPDESSAWEEFKGTVMGPEFSATIAHTPPGRLACGHKESGSNHITGRFSRDANTLTAEEESSAQLENGENITFHGDWKATRQ